MTPNQERIVRTDYGSYSVAVRGVGEFARTLSQPGAQDGHYEPVGNYGTVRFPKLVDARAAADSLG